jgi:hypothetical protein
MKPAATTPAPTPAANAKTGTTVVKSAPPKETARITVKPNLPSTVPVTTGNVPVPTVPATPAAPKAVAKATKPATTIVKTGTTRVSGTTARTAAVAAGGAAAVGAGAMVYEEAPSTVLTTALAGALALFSWGTFGVLLASYEGWM